MEDALSLKEAIDAAIRYRLVRTDHDAVEFEDGGADDDLIDRQQALLYVRIALERGDVITLTVPEDSDVPDEPQKP